MSGVGQVAEVPRTSSNKRRANVLLFGAFAAFFVNGLVSSLHGPMFPPLALRHDMEARLIGVVFGMYSVGLFVTTWLSGYMIRRSLSAWTMVAGGTTTVGVMTFIFGFMTHTRQSYEFVMGSIGLRMGEAAGAAGIISGGYTFIATTFPDRGATYMGFVGMAAGIGACLGPLLGIFFGQHFSELFISVGVVIIIFGIVLCCLHRIKPDEESCYVEKPAMMKPFSAFTVLKKSSLLWNTVLILVPYINLGLLSSTLTIYIMQIEGGPATVQVNLLFFLLSISSGLTMQIVGFLNNNARSLHGFLFFGMLWTAVCLLFLGPMYPLNQYIKPNLYMIGGMTFALGIGSATQFITLTNRMYRIAPGAGIPLTQANSAVLSSILGMAYALGIGIGATVGGFGMGSLGFGYSSVIFFVIQLLVLMSYSCSWMIRSNRKRRHALGQMRIETKYDGIFS